MKKYKVRVFGMGIDAVAIMPFTNDPTPEEIENLVALYLDEGLMKVEAETFYNKSRYTITYEELKD